MKNIGKRLFLIAFIFAIITAGAVFLYLQSLEKETVIDISKTTIIVASKDIPPRTIIKKDMIKEVEISDDGVYGDFLDEIEDIIGKYSKETILKDERFHKAKLIDELEEDLTMRINGNLRAVSINVTGESGVSDLIKSGDFVDIIVYLPEIKEAERIVRPDLSKLILQNIEILAIDKHIYRDSEEREEIPTNYLVTLSVPVYEIEKLVLAEDIGDLKLALRPLEADYVYQTEGTIWQELLLDDFYKMKDLFPQYEMKPVPGTSLDSENYQYEKYYYYTIKYGDTLRKISQVFYESEDYYQLIKEVNRIEDENNIIAGTGIKIPVLDE